MGGKRFFIFFFWRDGRERESSKKKSFFFFRSFCSLCFFIPLFSFLCGFFFSSLFVFCFSLSYLDSHFFYLLILNNKKVHEESTLSTPAKLAQQYVVIEAQDKFDLLFSFIRTHLRTKCIVFASSCKQVKKNKGSGVFFIVFSKLCLLFFILIYFFFILSRTVERPGPLSLSLSLSLSFFFFMTKSRAKTDLTRRRSPTARKPQGEDKH